MDPATYDEFAYFDQNLAEWGLPGPVPPVKRCYVVVDGLRHVSALRWGEGDATMVLLHGGAQNAHTYDTVALALGRPLLAVDLPGHGHSDPTPYPYGDVGSLARDVTSALALLLDRPTPLVGMSLGGLVAIDVASQRPDLVSSLTLLDITPGITGAKARAITDFVNGPATFRDFEEMVARTIAHHPHRSASSLRRGVAHNALQRPDGTWVWRHQRAPHRPLEAPADLAPLWDELGELTMPVTLVRALGEGSVVDEDDVATFRRRVTHGVVIGIDHAGHSIQGDQPLALARVLERVAR